MSTIIHNTYISIVGPPGSGKTTLLNNLKKCGLSIIEDVVEEMSLLDEFHINREDLIAFTFQIAILQKRSEKLKKETIIERNNNSVSRISDFDILVMGKVFSNMFISNYLKELYLKIENSVFEYHDLNKPVFTIFLDAPESILQKRIEERDGYADDKIKLKTIREIRKNYLLEYENYRLKKVILDTEKLSAKEVFFRVQNILEIPN